MKKFFAMLLVVVALGGFTIGCGGAADSPATGDGADATTDAGAEDAGAEDAGAEDAGAEDAAE